GSVRGPASHCGLFGIRPTHGRVSLAGCHDLAPSLDTGGFFAREGATFLRVAALVLGPDPGALPARVRPLLAADAFGLLDDAAAAAFAPALARVEAHLGPAEGRVAAAGGFEPLYRAFRVIQGYEAWIVDGPLIERYHPPLGPGVLDRFDYARTVTQAQWREAEDVRRSFRAALRDLVGDDGVLVLPTMPDVAPLLTEGDEALNDYRMRALNLLCLSVLSGLPQVSMPLATRLGAPLGLSLLGPPGSDLGLVRLAVAIAADGRVPA
ncbi:MAG: amidase family protein, partial [Microvirga sp.]